MATTAELEQQYRDAAAQPDYSVNENDERFGKVDAEIQQQGADINNIYGDMINNSDKYFENQIQASKDWADKQSQIQQENTDFTIEKIEQEKEKARKDYTKEQSGAYVDWQKQSNKYGAEAEKMASAGLSQTGYSESSQVSMYNTYQNRIATARESFNNAVLNYNNSIKDAQLQNNAALAEIGYNAFRQQLELSLQGFQYKNQLVMELTDKKMELSNIKWNRYRDVLQQINTENALKEEVRQYDTTLKYNEWQAQAERDYKAQQDALERDFSAKQAELDRQHDIALVNAKTKAEKELADHNHKIKMKELEQQLANANAAAKYEYDLARQQAKISGGSGASKGAVDAANNSTRNKNQNDPRYVKTDFFNGQMPQTTYKAMQKYGTFSNGYQPKGIEGYGAVSKTGDTIMMGKTTVGGKKVREKQNVWKTSDGTKWIWDGMKMKYVKA